MVSLVWSTRIPALKGTWKRDYTSVLESKACIQLHPLASADSFASMPEAKQRKLFYNSRVGRLFQS